MTELEELKKELAHVRANHADMVRRNQALQNRPDLKERAAGYQALVKELDAFKQPPTQGFIQPELYRLIVNTSPVLTMDINVLSANGQILQVQRRDEPLAGEWWTPGGRIHKGEDMVEACHRIIGRELGITPPLAKTIQFKGVLPFKHYKSAWSTDAHTVSLVLDVMLGEGFADDMIRLDETSLAWRWAHVLDKHEKFTVIQTYTTLKGES